jgi:hypothetical protein
VAAYDGHSESKKSPAASVVLPNAPAATTLTNLFAGAPGSADPAEARYTPDAVLLNDGKTILLAYTKGMERHNLAHLAGRTSADHGATWSAEFTLLPTGSYAGVGKPEFFKINSEIIGLVYSIWTQDGTSRRGFRSTTDNGKTWSPEVIVADGFGGRNASGCIAGKGRLISLLGKAGDPGRHLLYVTWSDNQGATWSQPALVSAKPRGESAAAYLGNDTVLVITRSAKTDTEPCYLLFKSTDNGETFFELPDSSAIWCGSDNPPELTVIPGTSTVLAVVDSYKTSAAAVQKGSPCQRRFCQHRRRRLVEPVHPD